jgi:competence protein ComEA
VSFLGSEYVRDLARRAGLAELSPGALRGLMGAVLVVVGVALWRFWPTAPAPEVAFEADLAEETTQAQESAPETTLAPLVVHVAGCVARPGVYELPVGSRVADAVVVAGGALDEAATDAINLARLLSDGEQIYLPNRDEVAAGAPVGTVPRGAHAPSGGGGAVNINSASVAELETLPGVGPATAQKIVDDREKNGPFAAPEDLMRVPGIGPKKFEAMKDLVTCG